MYLLEFALAWIWSFWATTCTSLVQDICSSCPDSLLEAASVAHLGFVIDKELNEVFLIIFSPFTSWCWGVGQLFNATIIWLGRTTASMHHGSSDHCNRWFTTGESLFLNLNSDWNFPTGKYRKKKILLCYRIGPKELASGATGFGTITFNQPNYNADIILSLVLLPILLHSALLRSLWITIIPSTLNLTRWSIRWFIQQHLRKQVASGKVKCSLETLKLA